MSFTLWFTGLSGSGKTTLSRRVYFEIKRRSLRAELLDGDIIRTNFSRELGFSRRDRDINVRRIGFVSHLLTKNDVISIVAAIAPYAEARAQNRRLIGRYVEVHCDCPLKVVERRDVKGLYARARAGEIPHFTGISDPYEIPQSPEIVVHTDQETVEESFQKIVKNLENNAYIPEEEFCTVRDYTEDEERRIREELAVLGYARR